MRLIIDANAVLSVAIDLQRFQPIAGRLAKVVQAIGVIEHLQLAARAQP
jgi:hypothetical protein